MKKIIFMLITLFSVVCVNAQTVESSRFTDNWSVGLKGGVVTPLNHSAFWGDMRGLVGVELKKEVTPIFGLGVEGEWSVNTSNWARNLHSYNAFDHQMVGGFMTANLMNVFAGYNGKPRMCEVEAVAGIGWLHSYETVGNDLNSWYTKFGANLNFNLGVDRAWVLSFKPAIVFDMYDGVSTNYNLNRAYLELQVGVTYRFKNHNGTHSFKLCDKVATQAEVDDLNAEINELRSREPVVRYVEKVVTNEVVIDNSTVSNTVGFTINSAKVSETEYASLANVSEWIKAHPDVKVTIKGYADKNTGTNAYNLDLATRRAENVKAILVNDFGVDEEQLNVCGVGDAEQPYNTNNWNRVVVFSVNQ